MREEEERRHTSGGSAGYVGRKEYTLTGSQKGQNAHLPGVPLPFSSPLAADMRSQTAGYVP